MVLSHIVCGIVDLQSLAMEDLFTSDEDGIPLFICELAISVTLVFTIEEMS
jgi:hypothetical protein